jgi:hypothetical protein
MIFFVGFGETERNSSDVTGRTANFRQKNRHFSDKGTRALSALKIGSFFL